MFRIDTPRCRITEWSRTPEECEALLRWTTDIEMMRHITGEAWTDEAREKFLARQRASIDAAGVCMGPVRAGSSGEVIGIAGAQPLELVDHWHIGWWVDPRWQGQGLATELAGALLHYVCVIAGRPRALAVIAPANMASRRVAEKAGMSHERTVRANTLETRWKDEDVMVYALQFR